MDPDGPPMDPQFKEPLKNLSNQDSLKNHFLKEFFKEPINESQRTLTNGSLRHHLWFHKEPFKPGFFKEPSP